MFHRTIDLGCGDGGYYPSLLPETEFYVGIDIVDHGNDAVFERPETSFVLGSALEVLKDMRPGPGDLIVSFFSAHHLDRGNLNSSLLEWRGRGAEFLVLDARLMSRSSFHIHYLTSLARSLVAFARTDGRARVRPFLLSHWRFLKSHQGYVHALADYRAGLQHDPPFQDEIEVVSYSQTGALWWAFSGPMIARWMLMSDTI